MLTFGLFAQKPTMPELNGIMSCGMDFIYSSIDRGRMISKFVSKAKWNFVITYEFQDPNKRFNI